MCRNELKPFNKYLAYVYENKNQCKVTRATGKFLPYSKLKKEILTPSEPSNLETDYLIGKLSKIIASSILEEIRNLNKVTCNHYSSTNSVVS